MGRIVEVFESERSGTSQLSSAKTEVQWSPKPLHAKAGKLPYVSNFERARAHDEGGEGGSSIG